MKIKANNLQKKYGSKYAVKNISLEIHPGQVLGLLGPNGAGKSTTIKMLSGQIVPTKGEIIIDDKIYNQVPLSYRGNIGVMPQEIIIWDDLNIIENLNYSAKLQKLGKKETKRQVSYLIEALQFQKELKTLSRDLSGGYKRRLNLALSIIHKPSLIFLDEPTPGIDAQSRRFMMDFIGDLSHKQGFSIVLTDHYLDEAEKLSDYIIIIDNGEIVTKGTNAQLKQKHGSGNILQIDFDPNVFADKLVMNKLTTSFNKEFEKVNLSNHSITAFANDPVKAMQQAITILKANNVSALNISIKEPSLEDIFLILTGKDIRE